jgi:hypothetical protein
VADNKLIAYLQEVNSDIPNSSVRFRIYDINQAFFDFTPTQNPSGSGRFIATFAGDTGIYEGVTQLLTEAGWVSIGGDAGIFKPFLWDGSQFQYVANIQPVLEAIALLPDPEAAASAAIAAAGLSSFDPSTQNVVVGGYATGQSPAALVTGFSTPANITSARDTILAQGNSAWITATGFSTLTGDDLATALTNYGAALPSDVQITVEPTPVIVNPTPVTVEVDGQFGDGDRTKLSEVWGKQNLDPSAPVTRTKNGSTVTEIFGDVTVIHSSNDTDTVTSTRST